MIRVQEIHDIERLDDYDLAWRSLVARTRGASFFHTLPWLKTYWRHFGERQKLRTLLVFSDKELIGVLPLTVRHETTRIGNIRVLTYPLHDWGSFYSPIGPNLTATLVAAARHVRQSERDWDVFDLRWTDDEQTDGGRTRRVLKMLDYKPQRAIWKELPIVQIKGTWDEYLASRTPKFRSNVRRCQRNLEASAKVEYIRYRPLGSRHGDDDPRWDLYNTCESLAQRSWQGDSQDGTTLSTESVRSFLRDSHEAATRAGMVDVNLLNVNGSTVAYCYNYHCDGQVYGLRSGYDPDFSKQGVGTVLMAMQIENSLRRTDVSLDLGAGYLSIKTRWATQIARSWRHTCYPPGNFRAQALRLKRWTQAHRFRSSPMPA